MKNRKVLFFMLLAIAILQSCNPHVKISLMNEATPLGTNEEPLILMPEEVPDDSRYIGELNVSHVLGVKNCDYKNVMRIAKETAGQSGANLISITELNEPNLMTDCYNIKG